MEGGLQQPKTPFIAGQNDAHRIRRENGTGKTGRVRPIPNDEFSKLPEENWVSGHVACVGTGPLIAVRLHLSGVAKFACVGSGQAAGVAACPLFRKSFFARGASKNHQIWPLTARSDRASRRICGIN